MRLGGHHMPKHAVQCTVVWQPHTYQPAPFTGCISDLYVLQTGPAAMLIVSAHNKDPRMLGLLLCHKCCKQTLKAFDQLRLMDSGHMRSVGACCAKTTPHLGRECPAHQRKVAAKTHVLPAHKPSIQELAATTWQRLYNNKCQSAAWLPCMVHACGSCGNDDGQTCPACPQEQSPCHATLRRCLSHR